MSGKTTYWITTVNGVHAQVDGVEERDRWTPRGWTETGEPGPTDFVWMSKEGLAQPAQFAYGAAPTWQQMGWEFSGPPEPVDPTKDPQLFDQHDDDSPKPARRAKRGEKNDTTSEPAAGADENTKE